MLGAIFGDIVGSVYEGYNTKRTDFPLLSSWSRPTDDSIMTLAVAKALMDSWGESDEEIRHALVKSMQHMGQRYPHAGYGGNGVDVKTNFVAEAIIDNFVPDEIFMLGTAASNWYQFYASAITERNDDESYKNT